jgi:soluble lytic murein transglycosylase-like protein
LKRLFPALLLAAAAASANAAGIYPEYKSLVDKHAALQGLDVNLVWAVMYAESRGNRTAISPKNARGLMQVIPPTAARMGVNPKHLYDPEQNIIAGTRYLRFLSNRFKGNFDHIVAAYNAGEGAVDKYRGIPPYRETRNYVVQVRNRYASLSGNPAYVSAAPVKAIASKAASGKVVPVVMQAEAPQKVYASWDVFQEF